MRICMVGSGRMARNHSRALASLPGVELHTVADPDVEYAKAVQEEYGYAHRRASFEEALESGGFDAVVICTPNPLHAAQASAALRAGKHVLCELPVALSLSETEELGRLAQAAGRTLMVCHSGRFHFNRIELRRRIDAGEFHPTFIIGRFHLFRRGELKTKDARSGWVDNALWHHGAHLVDAVMDILGPHEPQGLHVHFAWVSVHGLPLDVALQWRAKSPRTGRDALVSLTLSHNDPWGETNEYRVIGEETTYLLKDHALYDRNGLVCRDEAWDWIVDQDATFVAAAREGRPCPVDIGVVLPTMRVLQAAWDIWTRTS